MNLKDLNAKQLKQVISDASFALHRRQRVEKALSEIQRISTKHELNRDDMKVIFSKLQSSRVVGTNKPNKNKAKVAPKYQSHDGSQKWSGRGRSPSWVDEICRSKGLTIEEFKTDRRYLIKKDK